MKVPTTPPRSRGRPRKTEVAQSGGVVKALDRALELLKHLAAQNGGITLTNLALTADSAPSSVHRTLITLQKHGFADFDESKQTWAIGLESFRVGSAYLARTSLVKIATEILHDLSAATGETANLAIGDNGDVVFLSQVETHHAIRAFFQPGTRGYMHASGIGKALLSHYSHEQIEHVLNEKGLPVFTHKTIATRKALYDDLKMAKDQSWAFDDEEHYDGMRCIGSAIFDSHGKPVAGVSISGPSVRLTNEKVAELAIHVRDAAAEVTRAIGGLA